MGLGATRSACGLAVPAHHVAGAAGRRDGDRPAQRPQGLPGTHYSEDEVRHSLGDDPTSSGRTGRLTASTDAYLKIISS